MPDLANFASAGSYTPDRLVAGNADLLLARKVTLLSGQNLLRGALLGKATVGAATPAANAGNTGGSGTIGAVTVGAGAKAGVYQLVCIEPGTNAGKFTVEDPDGVQIGVATVAVAFSAGGLGFTISDATDFVSGDGFTITVAAGSGKFLSSLAAAADGSQIPDAVLAEDCDASAGDKEALAFFRGDFREDGITFGTGHTAASVREVLRDKGINLFAVRA